MFILAHELAHVVLRHWSQVGDLYQQYIPGSVTPEKTDAVADALGREASRMARRHEFDADAFALRTLRELGYADAHALSALSRFGFQRDSATHPGTRKRLAALQPTGKIAMVNSSHRSIPVSIPRSEMRRAPAALGAT